MKGDEVYRKLAERWGYSSSSRFLRILETIMTPEEGELLLELPAPTPEELAKRLNADEESVKRKLPELARRGLVTVGKRGYAAPTTPCSSTNCSVYSSLDTATPKASWKPKWVLSQVPAFGRRAHAGSRSRSPKVDGVASTSLTSLGQMTARGLLPS